MPVQSKEHCGLIKEVTEKLLQIVIIKRTLIDEVFDSLKLLRLKGMYHLRVCKLMYRQVNEICLHNLPNIMQSSEIYDHKYLAPRQLLHPPKAHNSGIK